MELARNKRGLHDYEVIETFTAGIVLTGAEVKAAKNKQVSLKGSYVKIINGEVFLINASISRYKPAGVDADYDPRRSRKLLIKKREILRIIGKGSEKGLTLIPVSLYTKGQFVKVKFGFAQKRKQHDKREIMKKDDARREMERSIKTRTRS